MRESRLEIAAAVVWFVVGCLFAVILAFHVKNHSFQYSHISIEQRPGAVGGSSVYINGMDIDRPLQKFDSEFNTHIDQLNEEKNNENWLLIVLDIVGLSTAFLSGVYELLKRRAAARAYRTAIIPAPLTAISPERPPNKNAESEHSIMAPPATSKPMATLEWSALSIMSLAGLFVVGSYLTIRRLPVSIRHKRRGIRIPPLPPTPPMR